jgi:hypothetical protein
VNEGTGGDLNETVVFKLTKNSLFARKETSTFTLEDEIALF